MAEAFSRRSPKLQDDGSLNPGDDDGLSVFDAARISQQDCIQDSRSCYGLATLHVGTLRNLGLEVTRDPEDHRKVLIVNLPFENSNDANQEDLLEAVASKARIQVRCRHKRQA
jgi:hypothetical protein